MNLDLQAEFNMLAATHNLFTAMSAGDSRAISELVFDLPKLEKVIAERGAGEATLVSSLKQLRQLIDNHDERLPAGNLRRHFEQCGTPPKEVLEAVLRYYLSKKSRGAAERDKVDLIVTRWGRINTQADSKAQLQRIPDLAERLTRIYEELGIELPGCEQEGAAVAALADERRALMAVKSLRELIDRQVLLRLRKIKDELEDLFFLPAVLTELVEVNLSLHNIFQELLSAEQSRMAVVNEAKPRAAQPTAAVIGPAIIAASVHQSPFPGEVAAKDGHHSTSPEIIVALNAISQTLSDLSLQVQALIERVKAGEESRR